MLGQWVLDGVGFAVRVIMAVLTIAAACGVYEGISKIMERRQEQRKGK